MGVVNYTIFTFCTELSNNSNTILFVVSSLYYLLCLYMQLTVFSLLFLIFLLFLLFLFFFCAEEYDTIYIYEYQTIEK